MSDSGTRSRDRVPGRVRVRGGVAALAVGLVALLVMVGVGGAVTETPIGLPEPGALTLWGLPLIGFGSNLAAVVVLACLLVPLLTSVRLRDPLPAPTLSSVRPARWGAAGWLALTVAEAWFSTSDVYAVPVAQVELAQVSEHLTGTPQGQALIAQALLLVALLLGLSFVRTAWHCALSALLTLAVLVPAILTGHSASSGAHSTAVVAMGFHVLAAALWISGILALWWHLAGDEEARARAARRFSGLALWCFVVTGLSGLLSAYVRLDSLTGFVTSGYGRATLLKLALLVALGAIAYRLRRLVTHPGTDAPDAPGWRGFTALTTIELVAMSAAVGLGVALSRTPPPVGEPYTSRAEALIGGPLPPEPTLWRVLFSFQLSGFGLALVGLGAAAYVVGVLTLRRRGDRWPVGRTIAWFLGLAAVAFATMGGLGVYSHVLFSMHMTSHMVLSMLAPILLVMGSPITLALRALPGPDTPGGDGPRQLLVAFLQSRWSKVVTNPAFATIVFTGSLYAIYFTGLFDWLMANHLGHTMMEVHFLLAGFLYYEVLVGTAPLPKRLPHLGRLGILVLVAPFHAFFAISVMSTTQVIGESYYSLLERTYATDLLADQEVAGGLTWAMGEIPLLLVAIVLLVQWFRDDTRRAKQADRRADRDDDAELQAYNAMLTRRAESHTPPQGAGPVTRGREEV
ncbi:cytochrome c oxidase assembly protein [Nocardioides gilvus]|uniref:cytochrome c oxidase assembly protein n=1 Tax=Nocardioides gilvus TaxID=1735589 RepID=UPI000D74E9E8|nr:cytochrome c oxidase assembly protein [Nocardioides gilvus]